jgi:DNA-binding CsgD family transcriptional regulator/tetratricopeptide (TPR) repeat protein
LVGRQRELATLESRFDAAADGRTRVTLVAGEPGIGKTHLLHAVAAHAAGAGALVLRGGASEAEGMPPYLPFLEALGRHIRAATPETLRAQTGPLAPILATIFPELGQYLGELPPSYPLPAEQARLRLYEAVGDFLAMLAAPRGLLLILDDLHWADPAGLDLLCHVVGHQPAARLLILGAYREGDIAQRPAFERTLAELTRLRRLDTLVLGPLTNGAIAELAAEYLDGPLDGAAANLLCDQSEGIPFFAEELLRGWLETGALQRSGDDTMDRAYTLPAAATLTIPASIMGAIRRRLTRLAPEVVDLLRAAAIIGRTFDVPMLAEVVGREPEVVELRLEEAAAARLLQPITGDTVSFSHDKIRECLYQEVTTTRRRRLHGFIGRALETQAEASGSPRLPEMAFHFTRSGDRTRGIHYAMLAAEQAMNAFAADEAMTHYRAALDLSHTDDPRHGDLLLGLSDAAVLAGIEREALAGFQAARIWFEQMDQPLRAARAAHGAGQALARLEEHQAARRSYETAIALLEGKPGPELVQVLVDLGSLLAVSLQEQAAGIAHGLQALNLARDLADERLIAAASRAVGNLLMRSNDLIGGIQLLEQALSLAATAHDPVEGAECCACLAPAYFWQGAIERSRAVTLQRLAFARRSHDPYQLRHIYTWLAMLAAVQGKLDEAEQMLDREQPIIERLASPEPRAWLQFCRGALAYERGDYAWAEARLQEAIVMFRAIGPGALLWYLGFLGVAQAAQGKTTEAGACRDELEMLLAALPADSMSTADPLAHLTQISLALGEWERLTHYYTQLTAFQGQFRDFLIDRLLGEIETKQGHLSAAQVHLAAAEAVARREGLLPELARTLEAQAELLTTQGNRDHGATAQALLEQAADLCRRFGNLAKERQRRGRLEMQASGQPRRIMLPVGLSDREAEVLRLVAEGKSNREIAGFLHLSESTVAHHLTSIFTKTATDNRAAATAFAIRHGLA